MTMTAKIDVIWCDGGPWDGRTIDVPSGHTVIFVPDAITEGDEMQRIEHTYHRFGNVAVYDGWRHSE